MNNNPTELIKLMLQKMQIHPARHTEKMAGEALILIKQHYAIKVREAIEDIHPYASGSNESTSMQEACLVAASGAFK